MEVNSEKGDRRRRVGLVYDDRMCKHATADGDHYPENPDRIRAIWKKLESAGIPQRFPLLFSSTICSFLRYIWLQESRLVKENDLTRFGFDSTHRKLNMLFSV